MAELKTKPNKVDVYQFIQSVENQRRRQDALVLLDLMKKITGVEPVMWGPSIVGFGKYHYKYESSREGDSFLVGFSPRKQNMSIYLICDYDKDKKLMDKLGKHKSGKGCLYINKLEDVNLNILKVLIESSIEFTKIKYPVN